MNGYWLSRWLVLLAVPLSATRADTVANGSGILVVGSPGITAQQEQISWGYFSQGHPYSPPKHQPESAKEFIERMSARVAFDQKIEAVQKQLATITVPAMQFKGTTEGEALNRINQLLRALGEERKGGRGGMKLTLRTFVPNVGTYTDDFSNLKNRFDANISEGSIWDVTGTVCGIINLQAVPISDGILVQYAAFGIQEILSRSYIIPRYIFKDRAAFGAAVGTHGLLFEAPGTGWTFDEQSHVLKLTIGSRNLDEFEDWYANELAKHPRSQDGGR